MKTSKWVWAFLAVAVVVGVSSAVFLDRLVAGEEDGVLLVDNTYSVSIDVNIDDELAFSLEPGESIAHELPAGPDHTIEVIGLDGVLHEGSFALPEPDFDGTSKAAYILGPGRGYALVTVRYFVDQPTNQPEPVIEPVTIAPGELFPLDDEVVAGIDLSFPSLGFVAEGERSTDRVHLCHYNPTAGSHGCSFSQF